MPRLTPHRTPFAALLPALLAATMPALPGSAAAGSTTSTTYLSDLDPSLSVNGLGPAEKDASNGGRLAGDGGTLTLEGVTFAKGLGVHAAADLGYTVPPNCTRFDSTVGVDDSAGSKASLVFQVFTDGTKIYDSGVRRQTSPNRDVSVPVAPGSTLRLVVTDAGDGNRHDLADWAGARLTCEVQAPEPNPEPAPEPAPEPGSTVTVVGYADGAAGTPVSTALWTYRQRTDSSFTTAESGEALLTTSTAGPYVTSFRGRSVHESVGGTSRSSFVTPGREDFEMIAGFNVGPDPGNGNSPAGLYAEILPAADLVRVFRIDTAGARTNLRSATVTFPSVSTRITVEATAAEGVRVWPEDTARPGVPTVALTEAEFPSTAKGAWAWQYKSGSQSGVSRRVLLGPVTFSAVPTTAPAEPAPAGSTGTVPAPQTPAGISGTWHAIFADEFSGTSMEAAAWTDHEPWEAKGTNEHDAWRPVPATTDQLQVSDGKVSLKARRGTGLPNGALFTTAHVSTRGKFSIPGGVTSYTEARIKAPSGNGLLPAFWLLGNGDSSTGEGWPVNGEIDIVEFANNGVGEKNSPFTSLWFPKDVYTAPPGTWMNATHVSHRDSYVKRPELLDSWHTWGLYRSPEKMEVYIDGIKLATWLPNTSYNGNIPLPPMLFTNPQHIRLSLMVGGGWAGAGLTKDQIQEGDLDVDYVKVWQQG